jgi:hypothetical protein
MTNQIQPAGSASDPDPMSSDEDTEARTDAPAISPAIGPLPPIYAPPAPGQETEFSRLWRATARAAREAAGWAARHRPRHRMRVRSSYDRNDH